MREPRYRFSDAVRTSTRALALRMIHAGTVAQSPEELAAAIEGTEDLRERLAAGGYGSQFTAVDLFPLYEGAVLRATGVSAQPAARSATWLWAAAAALAAVVAAALIAFAVLS